MGLFWLIGGCAAVQPPAGPIDVRNAGFEDEYLTERGDGSWHFGIQRWVGNKHGIANTGIAQFKTGRAPEGRNAAFLSFGGSYMQQAVGTMLPNRSYELQVIVGRRMESSFGPGEYALEFYSGQTLLASKPGRTPAAGEFLVDTLRYDSPLLLERANQPLTIRLRNIDARQINFDSVRLYSWNRAEAYSPPELSLADVPTVDDVGCVDKESDQADFPHVATSGVFGQFMGLANAKMVSEHAALASVMDLRVIDNKWLFARGMGCTGLLGTHPLNQRQASRYDINTVDDQLRFVGLPHGAGEGSRVEFWVDGVQIHSTEIVPAPRWSDQTIDLPTGTRTVTMLHYATGWKMEHIYWSYLGPADPLRLKDVAPAARPVSVPATVADRLPSSDPTVSPSTIDPDVTTPVIARSDIKTTATQARNDALKSTEGAQDRSEGQVIGFWDYDAADGRHLTNGMLYRQISGGGLGQTWDARVELINHGELAKRPRSLWPVRIDRTQRRICADYPGYPSYAVHVDMPDDRDDGLYQVGNCE